MEGHRSADHQPALFGSRKPTSRSAVTGGSRVTKHALRLDPENEHGWCNRGVALAHLGRNADALDALQRACKIAPNEPAICNNMGEVLVKLGRFKDALAEFDRGLEAADDYAPLWFGKARALMLLNRVPDAADPLRRFLSLAGRSDPNAATAREWLSQCERKD